MNATDTATRDMLAALLQDPCRVLPCRSAPGIEPSVTAFDWFVDAIGESELRQLLDMLREIERLGERVPLPLRLSSNAFMCKIAREYGDHVGPELQEQEDRDEEARAARRLDGVML